LSSLNRGDKIHCFRFYIFTVLENLFDMEAQNLLQMTFMMWGLGEGVCHHVLQEGNIQKIIHSTYLYFDLVVIEVLF